MIALLNLATDSTPTNEVCSKLVIEIQFALEDW